MEAQGRTPPGLTQTDAVVVSSVAYPPGRGTVISSRLESGLPSPVQMAPVAEQSVVAGSTMVTGPLPSGSILISQRMLLERYTLLAFTTSPPDTVKALSRSVL